MRRCCPRCLQVRPRSPRREEAVPPVQSRCHQRLPPRTAPRPPAFPGCCRAGLPRVAGPFRRHRWLGPSAAIVIWGCCCAFGGFARACTSAACQCEPACRVASSSPSSVSRCPGRGRRHRSAPMEPTRSRGPRWLSPILVLARDRDLEGAPTPFHLPCPSVFAGDRSRLSQVGPSPQPRHRVGSVPPLAASPRAGAGCAKARCYR